MNREDIVNSIIGLQAVRNYAQKKGITNIEIRADNAISVILSLSTELDGISADRK